MFAERAEGMCDFASADITVPNRPSGGTAGNALAATPHSKTSHGGEVLNSAACLACHQHLEDSHRSLNARSGSGSNTCFYVFMLTLVAAASSADQTSAPGTSGFDHMPCPMDPNCECQSRRLSQSSSGRMRRHVPALAAAATSRNSRSADGNADGTPHEARTQMPMADAACGSNTDYS